MIDLLIEREGESELSEIRRPERIEVRREKGQEEQSSSGRVSEETNVGGARKSISQKGEL